MNDSLDRQDAQQAQAALDEAASRRIDSPHDRRVHGLATAGFGILVAVFVTWLPTGEAWATVAHFALLVALATWQTQSARSTPRAAKRIGNIGLAGTVVAVLVVTIARNVLEANYAEISVLLQVAATVLIALPMLVAGGLIVRGRR